MILLFISFQYYQMINSLPNELNVLNFKFHDNFLMFLYCKLRLGLLQFKNFKFTVFYCIYFDFCFWLIECRKMPSLDKHSFKYGENDQVIFSEKDSWFASIMVLLASSLNILNHFQYLDKTHLSKYSCSLHLQIPFFLVSQLREYFYWRIWLEILILVIQSQIMQAPSQMMELEDLTALKSSFWFKL